MDKIENPDSNEISKLSIHNINSLRINNLDYYFIDSGEGKVIFFLHGFPDMANTWDETISELSKHYRVIAPFLRGYYPTTIPLNANYSIKTIAGDIVELAEQLKIEKFIICGQDWGASISYAVANLAGHKVTKIITIAIAHASALKITPGLLFAGRHFILFNLKTWALYYTKLNNFEYIDVLYRRWSPDFKDYKKSSNAIKETFEYKGRLQAALGYYWSFFKDARNKDLLKFYFTPPNVPVLFMGGENDIGVNKESVAGMKNKMPHGSKVIIFKNAGHFLHREIFNEYIKELKLFIK